MIVIRSEAGEENAVPFLPHQKQGTGISRAPGSAGHRDQQGTGISRASGISIGIRASPGFQMFRREVLERKQEAETITGD
jgi:hypothetical protein